MIHPCDLCGSTARTLIPQSGAYGSGGVHVCNSCGFVYVPERRSTEEIARSWDTIFGDDYSSSWPMPRARLFWVAEFIDQSVGLAGKTLLDIGAGEGHFVAMVRARGGHPVGLEPSKANYDKIRALDIFCHHGTVESVGYAGKFDIVTILWTLENCQDMNRMLSFARESINAGGYLVVVTGSRILVPYKKPIDTYFSQTPPDTHAFRFSANSLERALFKHGFAITGKNIDREQDWLLRIGRKPDFPLDSKFEPPKDDLIEVLNYFTAWERDPWAGV